MTHISSILVFTGKLYSFANAKNNVFLNFTVGYNYTEAINSIPINAYNSGKKYEDFNIIMSGNIGPRVFGSWNYVGIVSDWSTAQTVTVTNFFTSTSSPAHTVLSFQL